jgi:hypothetical protein
MIRGRPHAAPAAGAALLLALAAAGCESTQDKSARIAKHSNQALNQKGLQITKRSNQVRVLKTFALNDANGSAAVVELRNLSGSTLANVPIAIDVRDGHGASVFKNDAPGIEPTLIAAPVLLPRRPFTWVNDQVQTGGGVSVAATVGAARAVPAKLPKLTITPPKLLDDPVSGLYAMGFVRNDSTIEQRKLIIFGVARHGGRVVAAGRSGIDRLKPGKRGERGPHRPQVKG